jgi:membrane protease subunit (stomatin/prohibitin family)
VTLAIIDRIKFDGMKNGKEWLIYRYPGEAFVAGSQLIVGEGQVAVFVKGGQALDYFTAGTYTLSTSNIPLLHGIIGLAFGGKTPFTAEVYFINTTSKLDINWGTLDPIQLIDPKYNIKLRIRAFGQFGMKVADYRVFLTELIGSMNPLEVVNYTKMLNYFKGVLVMKTKSLIAQAIINNKVSALEISASIDDISKYCKEEISEEFNRFGLKVVNLYIQSINFPDEDFEEINKILREKASFDIIGDHRYITKRSFDTMETAAGNEGGIAGAMTTAGLGLGLGFGAGGMMSSVTSNLNVNAVQEAQNKCGKCGKPNTEGVLYCSECGNKMGPATIKCSDCGEEINETMKFCIHCGTPVKKTVVCKTCNREFEKGTKFCGDCGTRLEV